MTNLEFASAGQKYLMNNYGRLPITLVKGEGTKVYDADGNEYLDFVAGIAVNSLGHCHPKVVAALQKQAAELIHCSNIYWIEPQIKLAKLLCENSCFDKVFFANSGTEVNEAAIKLARKYAKTKGHPEKYEIISMENSFHGRTLGGLAATGQTKLHKYFDPMPAGFKYVPFNDIAAVKAAVNENTCAILVEPVQGEGGIINADTQYLKALRQLCDEHDLLLIFDEVQVGMGRTGKLFAYQSVGVEPDVMTLAKALAGGAPISALLAKDFASVFMPGDHGCTFGGNPLVSAAGVATMEVMLEEDIPALAEKNSAYMRAECEKLMARFPSIKEIRGKGWLLGLLLDKEGAPVVKSCLDKGLLINCTATYVLRFVPPLNVTVKEVDRALAILTAALEECGY